MIITDPWMFVYHSLKGNLLAIGELHHPFPYNNLTTKITYADYLTKEQSLELFKHRNDFDKSKIVDVDVICRADKIPSPDNSFDAVVTSHLLEHVENVYATIEEWLRVSKEYVYFVVPDKRFTFDNKREITPLQHFIDDYNNKVEKVSKEHYEDMIRNLDDWGLHVHNLKDNIEVNDIAEKFYQEQPNSHIHVFILDSVVQMLEHGRTFLPYDIIDIKQLGQMHICCLIKKRSI